MTAADYRVSARAKADLEKIAAFTLKQWGAEQTNRYLKLIERGFELLAMRTMLGRAAEHLRPGLRRFEYESHVLFYRVYPDGIVISRVLHERQLPNAGKF